MPLFLLVIQVLKTKRERERSWNLFLKMNLFTVDPALPSPSFRKPMSQGVRETAERDGTSFFSLHRLHLQYANPLSTLNTEKLHKYTLKTCVIKSQYVKKAFHPCLVCVCVRLCVCVFVCVCVCVCVCV